MSTAVVRAGRRAADELLRLTMGLEPVAKAAPPDPNTPQGFDAFVLQVLGALQDEGDPVEAKAVKSMLSDLQRQWGGLTPAQRSAAIKKAAEKYLAVAEDLLTVVPGALWKSAPALVAATKKGLGATGKPKGKKGKAQPLAIEPSMSLADEVAMAHLVASQALYVRDSLGQRADHYSLVARAVVALGLEQGHDHKVIGRSLREALEQTSAARSEAYFRMVATVFVARGRAWSQLSGYREAGIDAFQVEAVGDEVTCPSCRFMHGRVFRVAPALKSYTSSAAAAAAGDPEAVKDLQPWLHHGKTEDGGEAIFYRSGGANHAVARVVESGAGKVDDFGKHRAAMSNEQLGDRGVGPPPFHPHCRCTTVPVWGEPAIEEPPPAPDAPSPPPVVKPPSFPLAPPGQQGLEFPVPLPANIAQLVRPLPTPVADPDEVLGVSPAEAAKLKAKQEMLDELKAWPGGSNYSDNIKKIPMEAPQQYVSAIGTGHNPWPFGKVNGSTQAVYPFAQADHSGSSTHQPTKNLAAAITAAAKKPTQKVPLSAVVSGSAKPQVWASDVVKMIEHGGQPNFDGVVLVKYQGKFYVAATAGKANKIDHQLALAHLQPGTTADKVIDAHVVDLDAKALADAKKKAKPPKLKVPVAPVHVDPVDLQDAPELGDAANILYQKTGSATGSNKNGGFFTGADGVKRYVKIYDDPSQAECEHLANQFYRDLGFAAPQSQLFRTKDGKLGYASTIVAGQPYSRTPGFGKKQAQEFMEGFVADVAIGNWDAVGLENAFVFGDGRVGRIDNGAAFLFRASGPRKPTGALNVIDEWHVFFSSRNPDYSAMARRAGYSSPEDFKASVIAQIDRVQALHDKVGGWDKYVARLAPDMRYADREAVRKMMDERLRLLQEKKAELLKPAPAPGSRAYFAKQYSTVQPAKGLEVHDLPETRLIPDHDKKESTSSPKRTYSGEPYADFRKRIEKSIAPITTRSRSGIVAFTGNSYGMIRGSEDSGAPNTKADAILEAFEGPNAATPEPGTTFRGVKNMPKVAIDKIVQDGILVLGRNRGVTSSTSWNINVAMDRPLFMDKARDHHEADQYKILYVFRHQSGIPVESISAVGDGEREILFSREMKFRVTGLSRAPGTKRCLVVECEEVVDP